jgi:hypothetical protein
MKAFNIELTVLLDNDETVETVKWWIQNRLSDILELKVSETDHNVDFGDKS